MKKKKINRKVIKHLKGDIKGFKREITEDKELIKQIKGKSNGKKKKNKESKK